MRLVGRCAAGLITVGGIGTIVAISGVCLYLLWTVLPLFASASIGRPAATPQSPFENDPVLLTVAESDAIGWAIDDQAMLTVFEPQTGVALRRQPLVAVGSQPTAFSADLDGEAIAIGFDDGTVQLGTLRFETTFLDTTSEEAQRFSSLTPGEAAVDGDGIVMRTPQNQLRRELVGIDFAGETIDVSPGSAILRVDRLDTDEGPVLLAWSEDRQARLVTVGRSEDLFTGEIKLAAGTTATLPSVDGVPAGPPLFVGLAARAAGATLVWPSGTTLRFDTRNKSGPRLVEQTELAGGPGTLTQAEFMIGRLTLLVGDSEGNVSAWFPVSVDTSSLDEPAATNETAEAIVSSRRSRLVRGRNLGDGPSAVRAIAPSSRSRQAAVGYADGTLRVFQVTLETLLAETSLASETPLETLLLDLPPGETGTSLYAAAGQNLYRSAFDAAYPEAGLRAYFRPVWYESYPEPRHVWQSSAGTNAAEPKLGLVPLVFGTLKATFYSMLFGAPLALLAAIYTSEFLSKPARARVKPVIEIMASLPSVVLGFLAAIVFAPIVADWLTAVIAAAVTVPIVILGSARLWQLLPQSSQPRWGLWRLPLAGLAVAGGLGLAALAGPLIERLLFAGDVISWLDGQIGSGFGAWVLLLLPAAAIGTAASLSRWVNPRLMHWSSTLSRGSFALIDLFKFVATVLAAFVLAAALGGLLTLFGFDPRGTFFDTYVQRNALVVGFVMGFAIIPLIYTLADDALNAVPESLRSASLGAGATPWQTTLRVVVPAAMSGLFSASMVCLGRAVGETMIVLMAAGNTPIMEINIFNGFQTLSAAIATEMPEAVRGSTHFRTLFLAALVLFAMTFLVNTVAELVRLRFRRRVVQM